MTSMKQRLSVLEKAAHNAALSRIPGIQADVMRDIERVALTCNSANELAAYLLTREHQSNDPVISLEDRRRADAVRTAFARSTFERVREPNAAA